MSRLVMVLAAEVAGVVLTHRLSEPFRAQLRGGLLVGDDVAGLLVLAVHLAAWVAAWWLLIGTVHDVVVTATSPRGGRAGSRVRRVAPAWVQRIVTQGVAAALVVGTVAGPAAAATTAATPAPVVQVVAPPVPVIEHLPPPLPHQAEEPVQAEVSPADSPPASSPPADQPPAGEGQRSHVVAAGENLWVIARAQVMAATAPDAPPPSDREVHAHWVRVIAANQVRSGDPDLIVPGEVLALPPLATPPTPPTPPATSGGAP